MLQPFPLFWEIALRWLSLLSAKLSSSRQAALTPVDPDIQLMYLGLGNGSMAGFFFGLGQRAGYLCLFRAAVGCASSWLDGTLGRLSLCNWLSASRVRIVALAILILP